MEEIRVATTDDKPATSSPPSETLQALRTAIAVKADELGAAISGHAHLTETRRINDDLAVMIRQAHQMEVAERADAIVSELKATGLIA